MLAVPLCRDKGLERYEISYAQCNRWPNDWYRYWFFVRTPRYTTKDEKGDEVFRFAPASKMKEMNPMPQVVGEDNERREACQKVFEYAV